MVNAILAFFGMGTLSLAIEGCGAKVCLSPNEKGGVPLASSPNPKASDLATIRSMEENGSLFVLAN